MAFRRTTVPLFFSILATCGCGGASSAPPPAAPQHLDEAKAPAGTAAPVTPATLTPKSFALPPGEGTPNLDFLAYEPKRGRIWIPMTRDSGSVEVFDVASSTFVRVTNLPTVQKENGGRKRVMGPSSVTIGDGVAYVGNRGTNEVCAIDLASLKLGACAKAPVPPDGVVYVASAKEVWVTSPHEKAIAIFSAGEHGALAQKDVRKFEGDPEGYAVDDPRGVVYTNYEDRDRTVAIDVKTHEIKSTWSPGCGAEGPRGLVVDGARNLLVVACTDHVVVLDPKQDGKVVGKLDAGAGVDLIDYSPTTHAVYAAAGKAGTLVIAKLADDGSLSLVASGKTADRARNAVVDGKGNAYLVDPGASKLLVIGTPMPQ
jgi:DNA-binding beta-propeller fold protein YncE